MSSVAGSWWVRSLPASTAKIDLELAKAADEVNRTLPMFMDQWTRMDATMAAPGKELVYRYTLVTNGPVEDVFPDKHQFVEKMKEQSRNNYRTSSDMEWYRQSKVTLVCVYFDEQGNEYAKFKVKPE